MPKLKDPIVLVVIQSWMSSQGRGKVVDGSYSGRAMYDSRTTAVAQLKNSRNQSYISCRSKGTEDLDKREEGDTTCAKLCM